MSEALGNKPNPTNGNVEGGHEVKRDFQGLLGSVKKFLWELLDIRHNTDQEATKESIIADIPFKGHTSWILICSIFIASIGLNANSTAVVIGAMLISPLMGPILGIGLSLAINDIDTLRRSLKNFAVMIGLSVLTAYLFFAVTPLKEESSELLARTSPDIRDVLIAFFGGLALVIARAKKGTIASVIFGVAIATALMPPLCTVGFGLAIGNWGYATGAMYLFIINTMFIALATFVVIKFLRFPMVRYVNSKRRKRIAQLTSIAAFLVMIPAGYTFYKVYKRSVFQAQAQTFIQEQVLSYKFQKDGRLLQNNSVIEYNEGENPLVELLFVGSETIPENVIATWQAQKNKYSHLVDSELRIVQGAKSEAGDQLKYVSELYESKKAELTSKDAKIKFLEGELARVGKFADVPFAEIAQEAKVNYENLQSLGFSYKLVTDFTKIDTVPVFEAKWNEAALKKPKQVEADTKKLEAWLKLRLHNESVGVSGE
ncbi:DUF389 domain-containing protein [Sediminicola luteus]|uniref:DUF389 domain-containing protein n=1 Tax=Sediminicola luteus TaxID=319238 RepID=A0A2A4G9B4_9FLAO|nr:DUF389 domain-containing protein [Sediminicola luteus]PCE64576.1 hypothetical protein B7P33_09865 [Sediminicola luteus]